MRKLKKDIYQQFYLNDETKAISYILDFPYSKSVNCLFSLIQETNKDIKTKAVKAMGIVVSKIAQENMESARIVMRRLMWSLNDESGGIGWGAPLAMGEIMLQSEKLAKEYYKILISYVDPNANFLEYEPLRKEAISAIKKLNLKWPHLIEKEKNNHG